MESVFLRTKLEERPMSPAIVVTAAAAALFVSALTKMRRRDRESLSTGTMSTSHDSFDILANNLKAAANKVDNSAAEVEIALKGLRAA
jgi:hypothetical protein